MKTEKKLYEDAIKTWGKMSQVEMLLEELGELVVAIQKFKRDPSKVTAFEVEDEMADVQIMLSQNRMVFSPNVMDKRMEFKLARLEARLAGVTTKRHTLDEQILESLYDKEE